MYFAPEVAKEVAKDPRHKQKIKPYKADIWSMGIVAVALICGNEGTSLYNDEGDFDRLKMLDLQMDIQRVDSEEAKANYIHKYFPFTTSDAWWRTDKYKDANDFVNAALKYNPDERKTAAELLKMPFVAA